MILLHCNAKMATRRAGVKTGVIAILAVGAVFVLVLRKQSSDLEKASYDDQIIVGKAAEETTQSRRTENVPSTAGARFVYLIQGTQKRKLPQLTESQDREIIWLTFKVKNGDLFYPKTTWTQGRNILLREAVGRAAMRPDSGYLYYIFLDDDLELKVIDDKKRWWKDNIPATPFERFEEFLIDYEPAASYGPLRKNYVDVNSPVNINYNFDAAFTAFHKHTLSSLLPYMEDLDNESWFYSQWFVILLSTMLYNSYRVQCNSILEYNSRSHYGARKSDEVEYKDALDFNVPNKYLMQALRSDISVNTTSSPESKSLKQIFGEKPHYWRSEGTAKKKGEMEYRLSTKFILENFNRSHPLTKNMLKWRQMPEVKHILYGNSRSYIKFSHEPNFIPDTGKPFIS